MEVLTTAVEVERPRGIPALPDPQPIKTQPVTWKVLTRDRLPDGDSWVYYALTTRQYERLSRNTADILRWVREAQWRLRYYRGRGQIDGRTDTSPDAGNSE